MFRFTPTRLPENPIVHPGLDPCIGTNINGPSAIRVPDWVPNPLGRYYLYFADHRGDHIRLAYADAVTGPWRCHRPGVLWLAQSGFPTDATLLCPPEAERADVASGELRPHIASPDVHVDHANQRIVMYFHGLEPDCTQTTRRVVSRDGLTFGTARPTGTTSYTRVFHWQGATYAYAMPDLIAHSRDGGHSFATVAQLGDTRIRHGALFDWQGHLFLTFTRIGDCPERILIAEIDPNPRWKLGPTRELLRPETPWEGAECPLHPSRVGHIDTPAHQLRDPYVLSDNGALWLFYACAGEAGLGLARLDVTPA